METHPLEGFEDLEDRYAREVPEDVAVLYSWANLEGARYRDFSANRREHRAQVRQRAAEQVRSRELKAQAEAEAIANEAETASANAHAVADKLTARDVRRSESTRECDSQRNHLDQDGQVKHSSLRVAAQEARKASVEREAAAQRAKAAALAAAQAKLEEQEIAAARVSAARQAERNAQSGFRDRAAKDFASDAHLARSITDPHSSRWMDEDFRSPAQEAANSNFIAAESAELDDTLWGSDLDDVGQGRELSIVWNNPPAVQGPSASIEPEAEASNLTWETTEKSSTRQSAGSFVRALDESRAEVIQRISAPDRDPELPERRELSVERIPVVEVTTHAMSELFEATPVTQVGNPASGNGTTHGSSGWRSGNSPSGNSPFWNSPSGILDVPGPAWLYPRKHTPATKRTVLEAVEDTVDTPETPERSKERIATRWFALRGVFAGNDADMSSALHATKTESRKTPVAVVFSIAGGAGKTSLVATLGRALSFLGERVLLSDTTAHGLLPFYFGANQLIPRVVRTFSPPLGSTDAPIHLVSYDAGQENEDSEDQAGIVEDLLENSQRANRVLIDLSVNRSAMMARLSQFKPIILVPLLADMNSVISIGGVETLFGSILDDEGRPLQPVYFLNQFDSSLPLHLDIREILKQQLGERLLPFVIRRSPAVGEALAEGMTVVDYDPGSAVAEDYMRVAKWLRSVSAPVAVSFRTQRWSEQ